MSSGSGYNRASKAMPFAPAVLLAVNLVAHSVYKQVLTHNVFVAQLSNTLLCIAVIFFKENISRPIFISFACIKRLYNKQIATKLLLYQTGNRYILLKCRIGCVWFKNSESSVLIGLKFSTNYFKK